jgi:hypothetical protein
VPPKEPAQRTVWIMGVIRVVVVPAMHCDPECGCLLATAAAQDGNGALKPRRATESSVGEQPVVPDAHPHGSKDKNPDGAKHDARPAEEPWDERQQREQMNEKKEQRVPPIDRRPFQLHPRFLFRKFQLVSAGHKPELPPGSNCKLTRTPDLERLYWAPTTRLAPNRIDETLLRGPQLRRPGASWPVRSTYCV